LFQLFAISVLVCRCTECQEFVCDKHGKKNIVHNCVVCPLRLRSDTVAMVSDKTHVDRA